MLWRSSNVVGYGLRATDGAIGEIADFLIDETDWKLRWVVVDTGTWLPGRRVILPPSVLGAPDPVQQQFPVDLTRKKIEDSPGVETHKPVSRRNEAEIFDYYGWTPYWAAGHYGALGPMPAGVRGTPSFGGDPDADPHLRSIREVTGYTVAAIDGDIGHVEEFLIDDDGWLVRYVVVDTKNWWPGRKVPLAPAWLEKVDWFEQKIVVDLTRDQVKEGPEYDPAAMIDRAFEERLHRHYGLAPYWY